MLLRPDKTAADVGARVLAALQAGRATRNATVAESRAPLVRAVRRALDDDIIRGGPLRGRSGRIARRLHIPEYTTRRILNSLFRVSDSISSNRIHGQPKEP